MTVSNREKLDEIADVFTDSFPALFRRVSRGTTHRCGRKFDPSRIVLRVVMLHEPVRMTRICRYMGISKPYMTALVDRLISEGLVERVLSPDDRRVVNIRITEAGKNSLREFTRNTRETIIGNLSSLDSGDISSLHRSMKNIRSIISKLDQDETSDCGLGKDV